MPNKQIGFYKKFIVERTDGKSNPGEKHHDCEYFALDLIHDPHAILALESYAEACEETHPILCQDLRMKIVEMKKRFNLPDF